MIDGGPKHHILGALEQVRSRLKPEKSVVRYVTHGQTDRQKAPIGILIVRFGCMAVNLRYLGELRRHM